MTHEIRWCAACVQETAFEMPPCDDGHGNDCLDLACVECGHVILLGLLLGEDADVVVIELAAA